MQDRSGLALPLQGLDKLRTLVQHPKQPRTTQTLARKYVIGQKKEVIL